MREDSLLNGLIKQGISRRDFMKFCSATAATLGLESAFSARIAEALETKQKPIVVWLEFQDCAGNTESLLRANSPTVKEIVLDILSVDYHETIMAAAGHQAEKSLADVVKNQKGKYIAIVEGSIPMKEGGVYCCIGGKSALDIAKEVCGNALATIAVGTCATYGGLPAANPNPTGAVGVSAAIPGLKVVNLPGCPVNVENITATVVYFLTFGALPALDSKGRPLFAYGKRIHDNCERRAHFDAGQFVKQWGDDGHRRGWCLYEMGCKGPQTYKNCPRIKYNEGTNWPVGAGHGCIGCAEPAFWDDMGSLYTRLPNVPGAGYQATADKVGAVLVGAAAVGAAAHAAIRLSKNKSKTEEKSE